MGEVNLNKIMLHSMPTGWIKQTYLQGFDFDLPFKQEYFNRDGLSRKNTGEPASSSNNPKKGCCSGNYKTINAENRRGKLTNKWCMIHGAGNFSEECKVFSYFIRI